jgi:tetratricopeptide (TPR) repeat protein
MSHRLLLVALISLTFSGTLPAQRRIVFDDGREKVENTEKQSKEFRARLEAFRRESNTMPPQQAAESWLKLLDEVTAINNGYVEDADELFSSLFESMPGPRAWNQLAAAIEARPGGRGSAAVRQSALRLFAHLLIGDNKAQKADLEALHIAAKGGMHDHFLSELAQAMGQGSGADEEGRRFEESISATRSNRHFGSVYVPDLVAMVGREKAEALLRKALVADVSLKFTMSQETETRTLAAKLATELVDQMKRPQWNVVDIHSPALYEAMEKKFPATAKLNPGVLRRFIGGAGQDYQATMDQHERSEARGTYLVALIAAGRADDAAKVAFELPADDSLPYQAVQALGSAANGRQIFDTLHKILSANSQLPLWELFNSAASRIGKRQEMLALAREAVARPNLKPEQKAAIQQHLYKSMLAADQVDEGIAMLRELVKNTHHNRSASAQQLVTLGHLLQRPELIDEGIAAVKEALAKPTDNDLGLAYIARDAAKVFLEAGREAEATALLVSLINKPAPKQEEGQFVMDDDSRRENLIELAGIYHHAGRHAEVLRLLTESKQWDTEDLASIYAETDSRDVPLGHMVAAALADAGKASDARKIVIAVLQTNGGFDPSYELLVKLGGDDLLAQLDALYAMDQFQERPLIWKASALLNAGKVNEAEAAIKKAISIDPSDGEQGRGNRMRAYAVLADVLEKKGDQPNAMLYREVVKAIRLSEDADQLIHAGLLQRGIALYRQALEHFADAYCIQSRIAIQLAELGMDEEAERHFRRAYELMPSSFGRVESHCFGCEGAFRSEKAQSIAQAMFERLVQQQPNNPQVHYLMGYLREQQKRNAEAAASYRRAVELDPDYLNAWSHLHSLAEKEQLPQAVRDAIALNLLRLDPLRRHTHAGLDQVSNLKELWEAAGKAASLTPPKPKTLYSLKASAEELAKPKQSAEHFRHSSISFHSFGGGDGFTSPGQAIAEHKVVKALIQIMGYPQLDQP